MRLVGKLWFSIAFLSACGTVKAAQPETEAPPFLPLPSESSEEVEKNQVAVASLDADAPLPIHAVAQTMSSGGLSRSNSPRTVAFAGFTVARTPAAASTGGEMLDIEATLNIVVNRKR